MMKKKLLIFILLAMVSFSGAATNNKKINSTKAKFIKSLIKQMTLEEKINQLNNVLSGGDPDATAKKEAAWVKAGAGAIFNVAGANLARKYQKLAVDSTRLKIPLLFGFDCVHGMRTIFPIPLGGAASWDLTKIEKSEGIAALEASALGVNWVYAPMVDVCRDARWGRIAEGAGEDPYLGSKIAAARVKGFQGSGLNEGRSVASCVKHYAAYGAVESGRDYNTIELSEGTMRNIYLPPYKAAINAGAPSLMSAFNAYHNIPATCNSWLLKDVLRNEWGFKGFVVSDFEAIAELIPHGLAADSMDAACLAINAGLDMDMKSNIYIKELAKLVKMKKVKESAIDEAVANILGVKYDLGLFENPYLYCDSVRERTDVFTSANRNIARDLAKSSIVLLKNKDLLPISKSIKSVAVIGELANSRTDMNGTWIGLGRGEDPVSILEGIKSKIPHADVKYAEGSKVRSASSMDEALEIAKNADVVILSMGEYGWMSGEGQSYANIELSECQMILFRKLKAMNKPVVVILSNGRPLVIPEVADQSDALLETWFLGTEGGNAIADVLFGDYNPSGKLPVSFPESMGQLPFYYNQLPTGRPLYDRPNDPLRSIYRDIPNKALFPFGYGLSYTQFKYSDLNIVPNGKDGFIASIALENIGNKGGEEVAQLYIRKCPSSISQPIKSLKGFKKIYLSSGKRQIINFNVSKENLKYFKEKEGWIFEHGTYKIFVGGDSENTVNGDIIL
ncbi:glycoside hydrolase family 3 N-terminal domain-containing protein [uncultured Bacteroides sp.]|uniref:glycoside hydrolase family 3 N-terminal domain-containing protein n=1 Tax=uncultured Bacteroides sp. TaxID=162156 RepID=UPI002AAAE3EA|nr:glycoside hydrolase family 3 N-terminal domain-containing protein [uncultured Bacteroides sp.]